MKKNSWTITMLLASSLTAFAAAAPMLPLRIYAVADCECNVYFDNLVPDGFPGEPVVVTPDGRLEEKRWTYTPKDSEAGASRPLRIEWRGQDGMALTSADCTVEVAPKASPRQLSILLVGDSLTDGTYYPRQLAARLKQDGYEARFIGSHYGAGRTTAQSGEVLHEGRGGWTYSDYVSRWTDADGYRGKSPFLAARNRLDFQGYLDRRHDGLPPDVIVVILGGNDIATASDDNIASRLDKVGNSFDRLIRCFRAAAPDAIIGIAIPPPPAGQDAFGNNYGTAINRSQFRRNLFRLWEVLFEKCRQDSRLSLIPIHVALDTEHHYPSSMMPVSAGSSRKTLRQTNALHPTTDGHRQIGDALYFWLRNRLQ